MPAAADEERIALEIRALLDRAVERLFSAEARTEALAEYVPEHRPLRGERELAKTRLGRPLRDERDVDLHLGSTRRIERKQLGQCSSSDLQRVIADRLSGHPGRRTVMDEFHGVRQQFGSGGEDVSQRSDCQAGFCGDIAHRHSPDAVALDHSPCCFSELISPARAVDQSWHGLDLSANVPTPTRTFPYTASTW